MSKYGLALRVQLVVLVLTALAGGLLKSGQSDFRAVHRILGTLVVLVSFASLLVAYMDKVGKRILTMSAVVVVATIFAGIGGRMTKTVSSYNTGYALMILSFVIAIVLVGSSLYLRRKSTTKG